MDWCLMVFGIPGIVSIALAVIPHLRRPRLHGTWERVTAEDILQMRDQRRADREAA